MVIIAQERNKEIITLKTIKCAVVAYAYLNTIIIVYPLQNYKQQLHIFKEYKKYYRM